MVVEQKSGSMRNVITRETTIGIRASTAAKESLEALAAAHGKSLTVFIRAAIAERVNRVTGEMWESRAAGADGARD
jgi:predicted transcriptional regulator